MINMTSNECYYKLKKHYCDSNCEEIITDICNYFDSNILNEFVEEITKYDNGV